MQLNHQPKRKFDEYTSTVYPPQGVDAQAGLLSLSHHPGVHALGLHPELAQYQQHLAHHPLHPLPHQGPAVHNYAGDSLASTSPPQPPVAGKEKKPRKKREKAERVEKPRKSRKSKSKEEEVKPKVLFRGSRFELWLETRFEEELLKLFSVSVLELSANLVTGGGSLSSSSSPSPGSAGGASWEMTRSDEERIYKEKWRKRYHVYSADVADLVADTFNFHIRIKAPTGEYNKLPFITPEKIMSSPLSSYSNYLSLLGGAHINPSDDHCGYPPGELVGEDACTLYEGSDVSFVLVGQLVGPPNPPAGLPPLPHAAPLPVHHSPHNPHHHVQQQQQHHHPAAFHAVGGYPPHHRQLPTDGNHP